VHYFKALATDYDGTIAHDGIVDDATLDALERLKHSGRRLVMVTGRELPDLERVCPRLDLFDRVVVFSAGPGSELRSNKAAIVPLSARGDSRSYGEGRNRRLQRFILQGRVEQRRKTGLERIAWP